MCTFANKLIRFSMMKPIIVLKRAFVACAALLMLTSCHTKQQIVTHAPVQQVSVEEHSLDVFIVMYDAKVGKKPLLDAIKEYKVEIVYDYSIIDGMALKKPADKTLEETMQYFKKVKGVTTVEYDQIYHLTDPVEPKLEEK